MTQDYPPDPGSARPRDDFPRPADDFRSTRDPSTPGEGVGTVYGPPTTVTAKPRRAARVARPPRRSVGSFFGDSRGITFVGAVLIASIIGTLGGLVSAGTRGWVGTVFTICFVSGCVLAALLVHREDLLTVAFMPPLLFVAIATAVGIAQAVLASVAVKKKVIFQVGYAMSFGARTMWLATGATAVAAIVMLLIRKRPARPPRPDQTSTSGFGVAPRT